MVHAAGYLAHLGIKDVSPSTPRDLAMLQQIYAAHRKRIPFASFDRMDGSLMDTSLAHLNERFVIRKKGGVCCEQCLYLDAILGELGFDAHVTGGGEPIPCCL